MLFTPKKILAIKLRALGDTVLLTSSLSELRKKFPDSEIHVAVTTTWAPLLENHPCVDRIWKYEKHRERAARAKAVAALALKLRRENFDLVINFHASPSSALMAFATGAKTRAIHFHGLQSKNRYSTVTIPGKGVVKPIIERDLDAIRGLGLEIVTRPMPEIILTSQEMAQAKERLETLDLPPPVLGMGLGASRPTKIWPIERFAELAYSWVQQRRGSVLVFTGRDEGSLGDTFFEHLKELPKGSSKNEDLERINGRIVHFQDLKIREVAGLLKKLNLYVGNDSGIKHLAIGVGTPTLTLIGPEDPFEWHPYPKNLHPYLHIANLACRKDAPPGMPPWCGLEVCIEEKHQCMRRISVEDVLKECDKILSLKQDKANVSKTFL